MGDNTTLNPGSGGDVIATEDLGAYKLPVSKIRTGAADVDGGDVTPANPFPAAISDGANILKLAFLNGRANLPVIDDAVRLVLEQMLLVLQDVLSAAPRPVSGTGFAHYTGGSPDPAASTSCAFLDGVWAAVPITMGTAAAAAASGDIRFVQTGSMRVNDAGTTRAIWVGAAGSQTFGNIVQTAIYQGLDITLQSGNGAGFIKITSGGAFTLSNGSMAFSNASGSGTGVTVTPTWNGAASIAFGVSVTSAKLSQADNVTNSATAAGMTVQAANATGTAATGGDLILTSGTGTTAAGTAHIQSGGVDKITVAPTITTATSTVKTVISSGTGGSALIMNLFGSTGTGVLLSCTNFGWASTTGAATDALNLQLNDAGATKFLFSKGVTPSFAQADNVTNSATAAAMTMQAQNATGTTAVGGALNLAGGTGTATYGQVNITGSLNVGRFTQAMADAPQTVSAANSISNVIIVTGANTGVRALTLSTPPTAGNMKLIRNNCTVFGITVQFSSGLATATIPPGTSAIVDGDGTNAEIIMTGA